MTNLKPKHSKESVVSSSEGVQLIRQGRRVTRKR